MTSSERIAYVGAQTSWISEAGACLHHPAYCGDGRLTVGSLFAGIGGFDLGLECVGMVTRWQVEIDPFCRSVLERHWPGVARYEDVRTVDWSQVERVDVLCGGFPCQPASVAGNQRGVDDERWLWPEFARAIKGIRPRFALIENVAGLLRVNGGRAFSEILRDLASLGYDAEWHMVSAESVGAPHLRERLFVVATDTNQGRRPGASDPQGREGRAKLGSAGGSDRDGDGLHGTTAARHGWGSDGRPEPCVRRVDDGVSSGWTDLGSPPSETPSSPKLPPKSGDVCSNSSAYDTSSECSRSE